MAAPQQQYQARSPHNERGEREDDEPRLFPLTSAQGRAIQRQRSGATLEGDSGESPLSDEETDERRAAEADWERTLERLKSELVPVTHVVAIDGSPDSDRAFSWAVRSLPRHDRLLLVYGTRRVPMPGLEVTLLERRSADDQRRKQRRKVRALAQHYAHRCEAAGVPVRLFVLFFRFRSICASFVFSAPTTRPIMGRGSCQAKHNYTLVLRYILLLTQLVGSG
jgi:hypothetical protein